MKTIGGESADEFFREFHAMHLANCARRCSRCKISLRPNLVRLL
jgi:hypothetical protein